MTGITVEPNPAADQHRISARVEVPGAAPVELYIESNHDLVADATPWLVAELPVAMALDQSLHVNGPVDTETLTNVSSAQAVLADWYPDLKVVETTRDGPAESATVDGVACFFSGGVDSFYSALTHLDRITHLIFARGFDIPVDGQVLGELALEGARRAAVDLGKSLIEIATNLRTVSDGRADWQTHYHGAAMAAVAHAASNHMSVAIVPGSYAEADLHPWGTHPRLDPHWSGSRLQIEHDALDVSRPEKVRAIAEHQVALDHLRVCLVKSGSRLNCGRCEKCVRTMINLRSAGALERCKTLPTRLDYKRVARMIPAQEAADIFLAENLAALELLTERDYRLERILRRNRRIGRVWRPVRNGVLRRGFRRAKRLVTRR